MLNSLAQNQGQHVLLRLQRQKADRNGETGSLTPDDYSFRTYNPSIARFLAVHPLTQVDLRHMHKIFIPIH
jgi:hypothetical protein